MPQTVPKVMLQVLEAIPASLSKITFRVRRRPVRELVGVGCGNGTQTRFLSEHYSRVVGVDLSNAALAIAHKINSADNIECRQMDVLDTADTATLHERVGDMNVYIRGVVHQLSDGDRPIAVSALAMLAGTRGHVFASELSPSAHPLLHRLVTRAGGPPARPRSAVREPDWASGLRPE